MALTKVTGHVVLPTTNIQFHNTKSTGIITATDSTQSTSVSTGALQIAGGAGIAKNLYVGGNLDVAGVLTYEDVTNIDAVGIITAQAGIHFGIGATAGKFDALTGITTFSSSVGIADSIFHIGDTDTAIRFSAANLGVSTSSTGDFIIFPACSDGFWAKKFIAGGLTVGGVTPVPVSYCLRVTPSTALGCPCV